MSGEEDVGWTVVAASSAFGAEWARLSLLEVIGGVTRPQLDVARHIISPGYLGLGFWFGWRLRALARCET